MSQSASRDSSAGHCTPDGNTAKLATQDARPAAGVVTKELNLSIAGMTCGHCVSSVREALAALSGVNVDRVEIGRASVSLEQGGAGPSDLLEALRKAGYPASIAQGVESSAKPALPQAPNGAGCCSAR